MIGRPAEVATAIRRAAATAPNRTVAVALLGTDADDPLTDPRQQLPALPAYDFPEPAVRAIGLAARHYCRRRGIPFTTSFHTRFGDYFEKRIGVGSLRGSSQCARNVS